jgi:hypothetical protein
VVFRERFSSSRRPFTSVAFNRHMTRSRRLVVTPIVGALLIAACSTGPADRLETESELLSVDAEAGAVAGESATSAGEAGLVNYTDSTAEVVTVKKTPSAPRNESRPSGLDSWQNPTDKLPTPSIDLSILRSGGPPPDGIPSIDEPVFHAASGVDYLGSTDPVVAVKINGDARAYPLDIMIWHELVNDTVGGVPVAVAYCPLCNSVTVYEREIGGEVLDFGVSGLLYNSSLVMYDRQTETLWSHFSGEPLYGALADAELVSIPATIVGFGTWRAEHPDGLVLNRQTGATRNYGSNPYPGYDDVDASPFLFEGEVDGRFTAMTRVVGVENEEGSIATAFPLLELRESGVASSSLGDDEVVAFWIPGSASALDDQQVSGGIDVGSTGVFSPIADGQSLTFVSSADDDGTVEITDIETGSTWNIFGEATDGELAGIELDQFVHIDTFWFAWIAFHPSSSIA